MVLKVSKNKVVGMFDFDVYWTDMWFIIFIPQSQTVMMLHN